MNLQNKITCPTCKKQNTWQKDNPYKPFCSDRCKLIDLGEWANETRVIPGTCVDPNTNPEKEEDV
ncbi:MAG: DNA gyrase inhibitor YacG [Legionella sp.]|nr:DNA gyrase inhibitor YacG [Legionella sp.]